MIARRLSFLPWLFASAVLLVACGSAKYEWSQANSLNTIAAYQAFVSKFPNDAHAADAMRRIAELQDVQAWSTAQAASTVPGYQQYLSAEPNGAHFQAARDEITSRERSAAWHSVQANETAQTLQEFLQKYPTGTEADRARDKLKMLAGYRAELGMAHSQQLAERERDALAKRGVKSLELRGRIGLSAVRAAGIRWWRCCADRRRGQAQAGFSARLGIDQRHCI